MSVERKISEYLTKLRKGEILFPDNFLELGSDEAIRQALHRLEEKDTLIRIAQGVYLYPNKDTALGVLYPSLDTVAKAIAKRDKARIIPTGVQALNKLGLSAQIPLNVVYLTDGATRNIQIGKGSIKFKRTSPKNLALKGDISSLVIQALREIGNGNLTEGQKLKINCLLKNEDHEKLLHDAKLAPAWIRKIILKNTWEAR